MRNIKLTISYDGTYYAGWQFQKNADTVQATIESALKKLTGRSVKLKGAGRTDSGVHSKHQVANFKTDSKLPLKSVKDGLNSSLPRDILIKSVEEASPKFDSQRSARLKHYRYTITTERFVDPFMRHFVTKFPYPLDIDSIKASARALVGRHNFKAFQASGSKEKNTIRTIKRIRIDKKDDLVYIDIWADGFLYNMARTIVGTLLEIGRGKFDKDRIKELLLSRDRALAGPTMPAKGLCLMNVEY